MLARTVSAAAVAFVLTAGVGLAQSRGPILPAEMPPATFTGAQYVDSRGCVFIRAGFDGRTTWVPRVGIDRQPMCGAAPTLAGGQAPAPVMAPVPVRAPQPAPAPARPQQLAQAGGIPYSVPPEVSRPRAAGRAPTVYVQQASGPLDTRWSFHGLTGPSPCTNLSPHSRLYMVPSPEAPDEPLRCSPQPQHPVDAMREMSPRGAVWEPWDGVNPSPMAPNVWQRPPTYAPSWPDGSLAPRSQATPAAPAVRISTSGTLPDAIAPAAVSRSSAVPVATGQGRFVQVGTFGVPANAQTTVSRLQAQGLPVAIGRAGGNLQVVMAGPFASQADIQRALGTARALGFRDAFVR